MKKILNLFMVFVLSLVLVGCNDTDTKKEDNNKQEEKEVVDTEKEEVKEEVKVPTITVGRLYGDINSKYKGGHLNSLRLNADGTSSYSHCGKEAGCHEVRGTYKIEGTKLTVTSTKYWDYGIWTKLPKPDVDVFTITAENIFYKDNEEYVLVEG